MANKLNNCYLINAPAGSGKTTEIKSIVQRCIIDNPKDNILCITYTNRAADELSKGILSKNVFIGTIHSFLHFFLKPYFAHQDILELYFEIYGAQISERIDNKSQKESIAESNARYIEKYGKLDYDMVRNNIKVLSYNESPFSSLYYGGLSHDDLIGFSKAIFNRYPVIKKRMTSKYQFIFIDEYQDTMWICLFRTRLRRAFYNSLSFNHSVASRFSLGKRFAGLQEEEIGGCENIRIEAT